MKDTVLIVEDNFIAARIVLIKLEKLGFNVEHANTGEAALEKAKNIEFYMIFMDIGLGAGMDGVETSQAIRELDKTLGRKHCPIIALTSHFTDDDQARYLNNGIDAVISKPLTDERCQYALDETKKIRGLN